MAGIKSSSMRDLPKRPLIERIQERGLIGGLLPAEEDVLIQQARQQFREGVPGQPALEERPAMGITAPGAEQIMFPAREEVSGIKAGDVQSLVKNLVAAGPAGIEQAKQISQIFGLGKGQASQAKIKTRKFFDEETGWQFEQDRDPLTGQPLSQPMKTGLNVYDKPAQEISKRLQSQKIPMAIGPLLKIDKHMKKYVETGELPGVGFVKNIQLTTFFKSPVGLEMQNAARRLGELELRILTGAAAPDLEKRRVDVMNALSAANSSEDYVKIYNTMLRPLWKDIVDNSIGAQNPGVLKRWEQTSTFAPRVQKFREAELPFTPEGAPIKESPAVDQPTGTVIDFGQLPRRQ